MWKFTRDSKDTSQFAQCWSDVRQRRRWVRAVLWGRSVTLRLGQFKLPKVKRSQKRPLRRGLASADPVPCPIRPTLQVPGRFLAHTRSPPAPESPASTSLSPSSPCLPAAHPSGPPPQSAGSCNSGSPAHRPRCRGGLRCPGRLPAPPPQWSDGGCLVPEWGDTVHCPPCSRRLSGTRYDGAIRSGRARSGARTGEGLGRRSGRRPACHKSGRSPSHTEPGREKGHLEEYLVYSATRKPNIDLHTRGQQCERHEMIEHHRNHE